MEAYLTPEIMGGLIRSMLVAVGAGAVFDGNQLTALAGALAVIGGMVWSVIQKRRSADKTEDKIRAAVIMGNGGADQHQVAALYRTGKL